MAAAPVRIFRDLRGSWTKPKACAATLDIDSKPVMLSQIWCIGLEKVVVPTKQIYIFLRSAKLLRWEARVQPEFCEKLRRKSGCKSVMIFM